MASPTRWAWVWVNSGSWWWTGRPDVLWFMGSQRVRHDWVTELNWTKWLLSITAVYMHNSSWGKQKLTKPSTLYLCTASFEKLWHSPRNLKYHIHICRALCLSKIILNISNLSFLTDHEALLKQEEKAKPEFYSAHRRLKVKFHINKDPLGKAWGIYCCKNFKEISDQSLAENKLSNLRLQ